MTLVFSVQEIGDFPDLISRPRFATYLDHVNGDRYRALQFYIWNAQLSAAFMIPLQLCEVAVRNGIVEALEKVHGQNWHKSAGFVRSLPQLKGSGYQPSRDLRILAAKHLSSGKVVAELKFAFWQYLFTKGQDGRLWSPHLAHCFPGYDQTLSIEQARASMFDGINQVRSFRNRIAHHEPIFTRNIVTDYDRIRQLIKWRRPSVANWLDANQTVRLLLSARP